MQMESLVIAVNSSNPVINVRVFIISLNHQNDPHTIIEITSDGITLYSYSGVFQFNVFFMTLEIIFDPFSFDLRQTVIIFVGKMRQH